ncbi:hypothetical protein PQR05_29365 [Paraburkholderia sediminicola]|uniref:hypothetical protein n=1 Tax=Paraburkholderia sediminicola TaxID=458836 RepID=UPI0038B98ADF
MHAHFDNIERELRAAVDNADDHGELMDRLERLINDAKGARFVAGLTLFGKQFKPGGDPATEIEGIEPPLRRFAHDDTVRTKEGYLARVGYYDDQGRVVVNVVYQAAEYREEDLKPSPI